MDTEQRLYDLEAQVQRLLETSFHHADEHAEKGRDPVAATSSGGVSDHALLTNVTPNQHHTSFVASQAPAAVPYQIVIPFITSRVSY